MQSSRRARYLIHNINSIGAAGAWPAADLAEAGAGGLGL
jgi:hypothetical protein